MIREIIDPYIDDSSYKLSDPIEDTENTEVIEIPDEDINPIEWIESSLDSLPEDPTEINILNEATTLQDNIESMPVLRDFETWLICELDIDPRMMKLYKQDYTEYFRQYRQDLKDWYNKNYKDRQITNETN
jgi:hypothetical protein